MELNKTRVTLTDDATGKTEARRLIDEKALHFSVLMAIPIVRLSAARRS
jgi:hypothetical protein